MEDISLRNILVSQDTNEKEDAFKALLIGIEKKYAYWFEQRKDPFNNEIADSLHNHWVSGYSNNSITFTFWQDSELPVEIQQECLNAFKAVYSNTP